MTAQLNDGAPPRAHRVALALPVAITVLTAALILWSAWPALQPARPVTVTQAVFDRSIESPVQQGGPTRMSKTVLAPGWLEAEPFFVACTALADGVVESMEVLEGDLVAKGQIVARLVSEDAELSLDAAKARVESARADVALAESEALAAQAEWDESVERERAEEAARGAVAEIEAELDQLPSLVAAADARLERLQEELAWAEESLEGGAVTELEVFIARRDVEAQLATVEAIKARMPLLYAKLDQRQAHLRAAQRHLDLRIEERLRLETAKANVLKAQADLAAAEVARDEAALELERMTIRSPIDGYVQRRLKMPGDKVMRGMDSAHSAHLLHVYDPDRIQVRVDVALADAAHVSVGQRCEVVVEVLPDRTFEGVVLRSTHEADLQKNTLQFKVGVFEPSPLLRPEMLTRVKFLGSDTTGSADPAARPEAHVLVPTGAVHAAGEGMRIWTVRNRRGDRGIARPVSIDVHADADGWATVSGDISPGELIVMESDGLADGRRVRVTRKEGS